MRMRIYRRLDLHSPGYTYSPGGNISKWAESGVAGGTIRDSSKKTHSRWLRGWWQVEIREKGEEEGGDR